MRAFLEKHDWILSTLKLNWSNLIADARAFLALSVLMAVQNIIYLMLWVAVFQRISSLKGWGLSEVAFLYGAGAMGYGVLFCLFGGVNQMATAIHDGTLDVYLARPRPVLPSVMMHRMRADSLGDIAAGIAMIAWFVRPELSQLLLILALGLLAGIVYLSFRMICHSLAFWGVSNEASENSFIAFLIASTNPLNGFGMFGKLVLLTVFPAGYIAFLPVEILREFRWDYFALEIAGAFAVLGFAVWLFHRGLRRYASGNRFLVLR
jgi:ABC-2 type transport system permease protein